MDIRLPKYGFEELAAILGVAVDIPAYYVALITGIPEQELEAAIRDKRIRGRTTGNWYEVDSTELLEGGLKYGASDLMLRGGKLVPRPRFSLKYLENYVAANNGWFDLEDVARLTGQRVHEVEADYEAHRILALPPPEPGTEDQFREPGDPPSVPPNPGASGWQVPIDMYVDAAGQAVLDARFSGHAPPAG